MDNFKRLKAAPGSTFILTICKTITPKIVLLFPQDKAKRIRYLLVARQYRLLGIFSICFVAIAHAQPVVTAVQTPNAQVQTAIENENWIPFDFNREPKMFATMQAIAEKISKMTIPEDGKTPIEVILIDNDFPNAAFGELNGKRYITINTGLINFSQNDDMLFHFIGHEMEHAISDAGEKRKYYETKRDSFFIVMSQLWQKVEESEVDFKSIFRRTNKLGLNPHGARDIQLEMRRRYGNHPSRTHPMSNSRLSVLDLGLTGATRGLGQRYNTEGRSTEIVEPTRKLLSNHARLSWKKQKIADIIDAEPPFLREMLMELKQDKFSDSFKAAMDSRDHSNHPIMQEILRRSDHIEALGSEIYSPEEILRMRFKVVESIQNYFKRLKAEVLGETFITKTSSQLRAFYYLEKFDPIDILIGMGSSCKPLQSAIELDEANEELRGLQQKVATNPENHRTRHNLAAQEEVVKTKEQHHEFVLSAFGSRGAEARSMVQGIIPLYRSLPLGAKIPDQVISVTKALNDMVPGMENQRSDRAKLLSGYAAKVLPQIEFSFADPKSFEEIRNALEDIQPQQYAEVLRPIRESVTRRLLELGTEAKAGLPDFDEGYRITQRIYSKLTESQRGNTYISSSDLASDLTRLLPHIANKAQSFEVVSLLIPQNYYPSSRGDSKITEFTIAHDYSGYTLRCPNSACLQSYYGENGAQNIATGLQRIAEKKLATAKDGQELVKLVDDYLYSADKLRTSLQEARMDSSSHARLFAHAQDLFIRRVTEIGLAGNRADLKAYFQFRYMRHQNLLPEADRVKATDMLARLNSDSCQKLPLPHDSSLLSVGLLSRALNRNPDKVLQSLPARPIRAAKHNDVFTMTSSEADVLASTYKLLENSSQRDFARELEILLMRGRDDDKSTPQTKHQLPDFLEGSAEIYVKSLNAVIAKHSKQGAASPEAIAKEWFAIVTTRYNDNALRSVLKAVTDKNIFGTFEGAVRFNSTIHQELRKLLVKYHGEAKNTGNGKWKKRIEDALEINKTYGYSSPLRFDDVVETYGVDKNPEMVDPVFLARLYTQTASEPSSTRNKVFEYLWTLRDTNPAVKAALMDPKIIGALSYDEQKRNVALFQLRNTLHTDRYNARVAAGQALPPRVGSIRPEIRAARKLIERQFPKPGFVKLQVIDLIEKDLHSSLAESQFIGTGRISSDNWHDNVAVLAIDMPSYLSSKLKSDFDRLAMIKHFIGIKKEIPEAIEETINRYSYDPRSVESKREEFNAAVRLFRNGDAATRTYFLQNFLGEANTLFDDPAMLKQIHDLILGQYKTDRIYRKLFTTYLDSVPVNEKRAILSYILSSYLDNPSQSHNGASVKSVLESMGPFGIKVGQYLRASGLVSLELQKELEDFFDRALEPGRDYTYRDLQKALGEKLPGLERVGGLVGSASLNYGVLVHYRDDDGTEHRSVIRIQREEAMGQIQNEDANWAKAIAKLHAEDSDEEIRTLAQVLDESRLSAMHTLGPGGVEMDLSIERSQHPNAKRGYENPEPNRLTGLRIEVGTPDPKLQARISAALGKRVSACEYVPNTRFKHLSPDMKSGVATQIVEAELSALFERGSFDPDGHPGNWLVDLKGKRLVRIDYAQLQQIEPARLSIFRSIVSTLFLPGGVEEKLTLVADNFRVLFDTEATHIDLKPILGKILRDPKLPAVDVPHLRLILIRQKLEEYLKERGVKEPKVRLSREARAVFGSISRMLYYRDLIKPEEFAKILKKYVGVDFKLGDYFRLLGSREGRRLIKEHVGFRARNAATSAITSCQSLLKLFSSGKINPNPPRR